MDINDTVPGGVHWIYVAKQSDHGRSIVSRVDLPGDTFKK